MKPKLRNALLLWGSVVSVLIIDQLTKFWVVRTLPFGAVSDPIFPGLRPVLSFTYITNTGVAFGLFPNLGDFFKILSVIVVVGILFFQRTLPPEDWGTRLALGLQVGGALGNFVDRIFRGSVVDFLDLNFWPLEGWPVFNVADSAVVVGVVVLLANTLWLERQEALEKAVLPESSMEEAIPNG